MSSPHYPATSDRPLVACLMTSSLDGRLHPSRWTSKADGSDGDWGLDYERLHDAMAADAWIVGPTTMAEMAKGRPHPPARHAPPPRPHHFASDRGPFAMAVDRHGRIHFDAADIGGDHVVVLLGRDVPDTHLAELIQDGISYVVAADDGMALAPLLSTVRRELGVEKLLLEGGGRINGAFLAAGLVDEMHLILAPTLDGSPSTAIVEAGEEGLRGRVSLTLAGCDVLASGAVHLRYAVSRS